MGSYSDISDAIDIDRQGKCFDLVETLPLEPSPIYYYSGNLR